MSVLFGVLLAAEESRGGSFTGVYLIGWAWGFWRLYKRKKGEGPGYLTYLAVIAGLFWWVLLLGMILKGLWHGVLLVADWFWRWWDSSVKPGTAPRRAPQARKRPVLPEDIPVRVPRDSDDFETVCAEWMVQAGFPDARRTPKGPDGGIDVIAADAVGQAKFHPGNKVPPQAVRALVGSRVEYGKSRALFFHYGPGYTPDAISTALSTGIELYQLDVDSQRFERVA